VKINTAHLNFRRILRFPFLFGRLLRSSLQILFPLAVMFGLLLGLLHGPVLAQNAAKALNAASKSDVVTEANQGGIIPQLTPYASPLLVPIQGALQDGVYDFAETRLNDLLESQTNLGERVHTQLMQVQASHLKGAYTEAFSQVESLSRELATNGIPSAVTYWSALTRLELNSPLTAIQEIESATNLPADDAYADLLLELKIYCLSQVEPQSLPGKNPFEKAFKAYQALPPDEIERPAPLLAWVLGFEARGDRASASWALDRLTSLPLRGGKTSAISSPVLHGLFKRAEWELEAGKVDSAIGQVSNILVATASDSDPALQRQGLQLLARSFEAKGDFVAAADAMKAFGENESDPQIRASINITEARLRLHGGDTNALSTLQAESRNADAPERASEALIVIGNYYLKQKQPAKAEATFLLFLESFAESPWRGRALRGKAWALLEQERYIEAAAMFDKAARSLTELPLQKEVQLKIGDAFFLKGVPASLEQARNAYKSFTRSYPGDPLLPQALYQAAICQRLLGNTDAAVKEFLLIDGVYREQSEFADRSVFQVASIYADENDLARAEEMYQMYLEQSPNGAMALQARLNLSKVYYREDLFEKAEAGFKAVSKMAPDSPEAEEAAYMIPWTYFKQGREEEARTAFQNFSRDYAESSWNEHVFFNMANDFFNKGQYKAAENQFIELVTRFPEGRLVDKALYWSGKAATMQKESRRGIDHFTKLVERFPQSAKVPNALMAQGDELTFLGDFPSALVVFEKIITDYPESYLVLPAWGRKGDCYHSLTEPDHLKAIACYEKVIENDTVPENLRILAEFGIARSLAAQKQDELSQTRYLALFYDYFHRIHQLPESSRHWITLSGVRAAKYLEEKQNRKREAANIYRRIDAYEESRK